MVHSKATDPKTSAAVLEGRRRDDADAVPTSVRRQIAAVQSHSGPHDPGSGRVRLPHIEVDEGLFGDRCPLDGYRRGWGLQFGDVGQQLKQDPLYRAARRAGRSSILTEARLQNLYLIITTFLGRLPSHNIIEFGAYCGGSAIFMAYVLREVAPEATVFALDTFGGIPSRDSRIDHHKVGDFANCDFDELLRTIERLKLNNLEIIQGQIETEFSQLAGQHLNFGLAHIDCDTFASVSYCEQAVWPYMVEGGYVVFDDANNSSCLGATQAVEDLIMRRRIHSEQVWPHFVFRAVRE